MESGDFDIASSMPMTSTVELNCFIHAAKQDIYAEQQIEVTVTIKFNNSKFQNNSTKTIIQDCDNYN